MSKKKTWSDVEKGDELDFGGRVWRVVKIKRIKRKGGKKPKSAHVMIEHRGRYSESDVALDDRVKIAKKGDGTTKGPLYDESGTARRWATNREAAEAGVGLPAGDPEQTRPPKKPGPDLWETPANKTERMLGELLSARLVGESTDEDAGYYVPPVDASIVASHLALFHGGIPEACNDDEARMLGAHEAQHAAAKRGEGVLAVNHWHTATRP